jgi:putative membrane-bound dehydrogenase-like protein
VPDIWAQPPTVTDDRLVLELVAREPDIVTPTGLAVDERGRVWVIENHTHQRPPRYQGPTSDRVRIFSDFDAAGRARKSSTFADGFTNAMSLALRDDGVVYLATRSDIYRLRDKDGVAGERQVIVRLDSPGDYPHNGLSGFAFDGVGNLYFSLGENLGAPYKLIGADGTTLAGGGEGGSIYRCRPDGTRLERVATGFWNTFHLTFDAFGRLFAVDNDPDSRGPCRLLHIVPGGDYGYRFRNGRKGLHPFTAWNGELPGTLPMVAGTAEAPSGIVAYESNGLPAEYRGDLLVTSWGDHVVERFHLTPSGASFAATVQTLLRGGEDFRPVGIATGPDGALYLSDWVDKSYPVHGKGRVWRLRMKQPPADDGLRPAGIAGMDVEKLRPLLLHPRREIRAAAGDALARAGARGKQALAGALQDEADVRARLQALWTSTKLGPTAATESLTVALKDAAPEVRGEAVQLLGALLPADAAKRDEARLLELAMNDPSLFVRMRALAQLRTEKALPAVVPVLADRDAFLAGTALAVLGRPGQAQLVLSRLKDADAKLRLGILLTLRRCGDEEGRNQLPDFLADSDPDVRRAAIQWVGEEGLKEHADRLRQAAARPPVTRELFEALLAANDFLAGRKPFARDEAGSEAFVATILQDDSQPPAFRLLSLRMLRPDHPGVRVGLLRQLLEGKDQDLRREAVRTLCQRADEGSQELLRRLVTDEEFSFRAEAILGLAHSAPTSAATRQLLLALLSQPQLRHDVLRSLRDLGPQPEVEHAIAAWWDKFAGEKQEPDEERRELAAQVLLTLGAGTDAPKDDRRKALAALAGPRPQGEAQWREALAGRGDAAAGERVFFHPRGPRCFSCHRIDGRGAAVGPDLSGIGRALGRDKLIESILTPSKEIAPQFVSWVITTRDGKVRTGVIVEEGPNSTVTVGDAQGKTEVLRRADIEERHASAVSLMPDNLHERMTRRKFLDLIAFLSERK